MGWRFTAPAAPLVVGALLMLGIAELVRRRRPVRGGTALRFVALSVCVYVIGYALELGSTTPEAVARWLKIQYLGVTTVPVLTLIVALAYTGRERFLSPLNVGLLFAIPATTCVLAWTNASHELIWQEMHVDTSLGFARTTFVRGDWYLIHNVYIHILMLVAIVLLVKSMRAATGLFRRQLLVLLLATVIPLAVHAVYLSTSFFGGLDPNPYALIVTAVTLAWGMLESALMDLVPVAQEAVFASQRDPVLVADARDRVVALNPAAQAVLGVTAAQAIGAPAAAAFPAWQSLVAGHGLDEAFRVPIALPVGSEQRHFEMGVAPLSPRPGHVEGRLLVLQDVTERQQAEKLREDLVSTLVHDLRNPLTVIRASIDLLARDAGAPAQGILDPARLATERLLELVTRLLEVHTLKTGRLPLERSRLEPAELLHQAVEMQAPLAQSKGLRLSADMPELPPILADRALLARVLQNLIGNAIKFTPPQGEIRVRARREGESVVVSVSDDGPGIPREVQDRLFQEFARGRGPGRGSGLGLAFCRSVVEAHGGSIAARSAPGRGATIEFTLPVAAA